MFEHFNFTNHTLLFILVTFTNALKTLINFVKPRAAGKLLHYNVHVCESDPKQQQQQQQQQQQKQTTFKK